jgi:FMN phosphatase YigB (HAD superfamily)
LLPIEFVFFDVGETLIDETRTWHGWAAYLGVTPAVMLPALDEVIAARQHHEQVFHRFRPGFDMATARRERAASGYNDAFTVADLYPDAVRCVDALRALGFKVGVAGNAPPTGGFLDALHPDIATSPVELGAQKPSLAFFARLAERAALPPSKIAYVGDRLDNDVLPARDAGMVAVFHRTRAVGEGARPAPGGRLGRRQGEVARRAARRADPLVISRPGYLSRISRLKKAPFDKEARRASTLSGDTRE